MQDALQIIANVQQDEEKNLRFLHLTPNEAVMSKTARQFLSWELTDRYYFGKSDEGVIDFGAFTALGYPGVDALVTAAEEALKAMLHARVVNLACLSGIHAMMCVLLASTDSGDTIMTLNHDHGGHFATKGIIARIGRHQVDTVFDYSTQSIDIERTAEVFRSSKAKAIYLDMSYYIDMIDISRLRKALGDEAIIIFDASHTVGLMLGGAIESPLASGADIVCANTHKTLPGPQKGLIAFRDEVYGREINEIIGASLYSSQHTTSLLALSVTILEMQQFGNAYAEQIIKNANALGAAFEALGYRVRKASDGSHSHTHQVHVITEGLGDYRMLYNRLIASSITAAFDDGDILHGGTFIRFGTQEITRRGMKEDDMSTIAHLVDSALRGKPVKDEAEKLKSQFPDVHYSFECE